MTNGTDKDVPELVPLPVTVKADVREEGTRPECMRTSRSDRIKAIWRVRIDYIKEAWPLELKGGAW